MLTDYGFLLTNGQRWGLGTGGKGDKGTRGLGDKEKVTLSIFISDEERGVKKNVSKWDWEIRGRGDKETWGKGDFSSSVG